MRLALFDLDHTLLPLDSDYAWGEYTVSIGWRDAEIFAARNADFLAQYRAEKLDIDEYVEFATEAIRAHGQAESVAARENFMKDIILPGLQPAARELVDSHRRAGDQILIVTATNEFVTRPIATAFGVEDLIAIDLERGEGAGKDWVTGRIAGTPSFREGKITRVQQWLAKRGESLETVEFSAFYSDSMNDLPLLERVHQPIATNPDDRLRALALARGWKILDLFA